MTKAVFREAMRGLVPDAVLQRRDKIAFATPELQWLRQERAWVAAVLESDVARTIPALDLRAVRRTWQAVLAGRDLTDFRLWRWLNLIRWADRFDVSFEP